MDTLAKNVFLDSQRIKSNSIELLLSEARELSYVHARAAKYKDEKIVEAQEIRELRDVLVSRSKFKENSENYLGFPAVLSDINNNFEINLKNLSRYVISKYSPGCHIKPHCDTDFTNTKRVVTGVYYLNEDYEGGEIYFPAFNLEIKPEAGSLLLFLSEYLHGVRPIINGERFSIVFFAETEKLFRL